MKSPSPPTTTTFYSDTGTILSLFPNSLPVSQLGIQHDTYDEYYQAVLGYPVVPSMIMKQQQNNNNPPVTMNPIQYDMVATIHNDTTIAPIPMIEIPVLSSPSFTELQQKHYTLILITEPSYDCRDDVPNSRQQQVVVVDSGTTANTGSDSDDVASDRYWDTMMGGRILLGRKQRGFGTGFYNSFGGKIDPTIDRTIVESAIRELQEETNITTVSIPTMMNAHVGTLHFTFEKNNENINKNGTSTAVDENENNSEHPCGDNHLLDPIEMIIHLFCIQCTTTTTTKHEQKQQQQKNNNQDHYDEEQQVRLYIDPTTIRGCDEITTEWFPNWFTHLPLHEMFADDTLWLTRILLSLSSFDKTKRTTTIHENNEDKQLLIDSSTFKQQPKRVTKLNGWFHYAAGGESVNTILHHYIQCENDQKQRTYPMITNLPIPFS